jgi:hypothetical protein
VRGIRTTLAPDSGNVPNTRGLGSGPPPFSMALAFPSRPACHDQIAAAQGVGSAGGHRRLSEATEEGILPQVPSQGQATQEGSTAGRGDAAPCPPPRDRAACSPESMTWGWGAVGSLPLCCALRGVRAAALARGHRGRHARSLGRSPSSPAAGGEAQPAGRRPLPLAAAFRPPAAVPEPLQAGPWAPLPLPGARPARPPARPPAAQEGPARAKATAAAAARGPPPGGAAGPRTTRSPGAEPLQPCPGVPGPPSPCPCPRDCPSAATRKDRGSKPAPVLFAGRAAHFWGTQLPGDGRPPLCQES